MSCKLCLSSFSKNNLPLIICANGHIVCQQCAFTTTQCPFQCPLLPNPIMDKELLLSLSPLRIIQNALDLDRSLRIPGLSDDDDLHLFATLDPRDYDYCLPTVDLNRTSCQGKSCAHESTLVDLSDFSSYFYDKFPFLKNLVMDNLLIAGGAVQRVIAGMDNRKEHSGYSGDIDFFIYGVSTNKALEIVNQFVKELSQGDHVRIVRQSYLVSVKGLKVDVDYKPSAFSWFDLGVERIECQIILRIYSSKSEILHAFDLGSCQVGFDGKQLFTTNLGKLSFTYLINVVDPLRRSTSYEHRLAKYLGRGFKVILPNLNTHKMREDIKGVKDF
ncbi:hypothetical protein GEMRC1_012700 [Eukaryota sp. GEM-RC1]